MFVFHIGLHKTGTTTLQMLMARNAPALAERGIVYPSLDRASAHHALEVYEAPELEAPAWQAVRDLRAVARQATVVLSSETFWLSDPRLMREGIGGDEARIIVYLRDLASWSVSLYCQWAKVGRTTLTFDEYVAAFLRESPDVVASRILGWAGVFGPDHVRVRSVGSDCLAGGNLVDDFLSALGTSREGLVIPSNANETPDWRVVELIREHHLRESGWKGLEPSWNDAMGGALWRDSPAAKRIREAGLTAGAKLGWQERADYLTRGQRRLLAGQHRSDRERLRAAIPDCLVADPADLDLDRAFLPSPETVPPADRRAFEAVFSGIMAERMGGAEAGRQG